MNVNLLIDQLQQFIKKGLWPEAMDLLFENSHLVKCVNNSGESVLGSAVCYDGADDFIALLLSMGVSPNLQCNDGSTPLGNAICSGHRHGLDNFENIKLLVAAGADLRMFDETGNPPLHVAVNEGRRDVVELLLHAGADPHQKNLYGDDIWQWMDWLKDWRMKDFFPQKNDASNG